MKYRKMIRLLTVINICIINCISTNAQEEVDYFLATTENAQYLVYGTRFLINAPENVCYEFIENISLITGDKFIIMHIMDEMDNKRGTIIFDKKGNQINYDKVQNQREQYSQTSTCCIYVEEFNGKLYFWDLIDHDGEDYDCYYDSQTDASNYFIPRYYIFEYETNSLETKILKNECTRLIQNGKILCH